MYKSRDDNIKELLKYRYRKVVFMQTGYTNHFYFKKKSDPKAASLMKEEARALGSLFCYNLSRLFLGLISLGCHKDEVMTLCTSLCIGPLFRLEEALDSEQGAFLEEGEGLAVSSLAPDLGLQECRGVGGSLAGLLTMSNNEGETCYC